MKRISKLIASLLVFGSISLSCFAQSVTVTDKTSSASSSVGSAAWGLVQAIGGSTTNVEWVPYVGYTPSLDKNDRISYGLGGFYNVTTNVMVGVRLQWYNGGAYVPAGTATFKKDIFPLKKVGTGNFWQDFEITGFLYTGVEYPISGLKFGTFTVPGKDERTINGPLGLVGAGFATKIYGSKSGNTDVRLLVEAEQATGEIGRTYNAGLALRFKFN